MKHHHGAGISKSPSVKPIGEKSAKLSTNVGSGSRPGHSKHKIETSAPVHPHKISRAPSGALK